MAMLRYLGLGYRQFGLHPVKGRPRLNWEFYAVLRGQCSPVIPHRGEPVLRSRTLWVFPSGSPHGWSGDRDKRAFIAAFHFGSVPPQLEKQVRGRGHLEVALTAAECRWVEKLASSLRTDFRQPDLLSNLRFHQAQIELTVLALSKLAAFNKKLPEGHAVRTVEAAMAWFSDHVPVNPPITEVAREVHVSPSTLRRLFREVRNESPAKAFTRIRVEAAMRLMTETNLKIESIAEECGYSSMSDFCRAFKAFTTVTPRVWRRTVIDGPERIRSA
jgi:AraC family transcriptional regulator